MSYDCNLLCQDESSLDGIDCGMCVFVPSLRICYSFNLLDSINPNKCTYQTCKTHFVFIMYLIIVPVGWWLVFCAVA